MEYRSYKECRSASIKILVEIQSAQMLCDSEGLNKVNYKTMPSLFGFILHSPR